MPYGSWLRVSSHMGIRNLGKKWLWPSLLVVFPMASSRATEGKQWSTSMEMGRHIQEGGSLSGLTTHHIIEGEYHTRGGWKGFVSY